MTRKNRYVLIFVGFLFFIIASPALVLYVKGISYDFSGNKFVKTGILSLNVDPNSVNIFLDGTLKRTKSGDIKFLNPGPYTLSLQKPGYQEWSKRLFINAGEVTWANPINNKIYLFLNSPKPKALATGVYDFNADSSDLVYLSKGSISVLKNNNPEQTENYQIPNSLDVISSSANNKLFALSQKNPETATTTIHAAVFNLDGRVVTDIGSLFSSPPKLTFAPNGDLYALENSNLYAIDINTMAKTPVISNVLAFALQKNNIYYLQKTNSGLQLLYKNLPAGAPQVLLNGIPVFQNGQIIITFEKQVFLLLDQTLFQVSGSLNKVANNVTDFYFNPNDSTLSFVQGNELDYYNNTVNFISRSSGLTKNLSTNLKTNTAFYINNNQVLALELDTRDKQNQYPLYSGTNLQKLVVNKNADEIFVLDGNELKQVTVR